MFTSIRRVLVALTLVVTGRFSVLMGVGHYFDNAPAHIMRFPPNDFIRNLPPTTSIAAFGDRCVMHIFNNLSFQPGPMLT